MITAQDLPQFFLECLTWAEQVRSPSDRQTIVRVAAMWMATASLIERRISEADIAPIDLRGKLDWRRLVPTYGGERSAHRRDVPDEQGN